MTGFATGDLNNDDAPSPQDGTCPGNETNPYVTSGIQRTHVCWTFINNYVHDNNNPNVPVQGIAGLAVPGTGMTIYGGRNDIFINNRFVNNGAWGVIFVPFPDTEPPPPIAHCQGGTNLSTPGQPLCFFDDWGSEFAHNSFTHNGFFGNPSNGDIAEYAQQGENYNPDSNCFHDNTDTSGTLTSAPANIDNNSQCGQNYTANSNDPTFDAEIACASQALFPCPPGTVAHYPQQTQVSLQLPPAQTTMPDPCAGVPANPWCPASAPRCPKATGRLSGTRLGLVTLGMTRARVRREYRHSSDRGKRYEDFFCLTPIGVRVGYASPKLLRTLPPAKRRQLRGRAVWASTSNPFYTLRRVRPGGALAAARKHLKLGAPFHIGLNWWYLAPNGSSTAVLKIRHGIVQEIGIANKRLTQGRTAQLKFMKSFS